MDGTTPGDLNVKQLLKKSIDICYGDKKTYLGMAAVVALPSFLSSLLLMAVETDFEKAMKEPAQGFIGLLNLVLLIAFAVLMVKYAGSLPVLTAYALDERPMGWTESFGWTSDHNLFWGVAGVGILFALAVAGGLVLLVVPGIIFAVWFMLSLPAKVLSDFPAKECFSVSRRLIRPVFKKALGFGLILGLIMFLPGGIAQLILTIKYGIRSTDPVRVIIPAVITYATAIFWSPVTGVGVSLLYIERSGGLQNLREDLFL